jgi:transposase
VSGSGSSEGLVEQLLGHVRELESIVADQQQVIAKQADRIALLQRRLGQDSSTSSRPPSSDAPWEKKPARKRSSRSRSGRKPGTQPGSPSASRSLVEDPDETSEVAPDHCAHCERSLADAAETGRVRRQVEPLRPPGLRPHPIPGWRSIPGWRWCCVRAARSGSARRPVRWPRC